MSASPGSDNRNYALALVLDLVLCTFVFAQWIVAGLIVDHGLSGATLDTRKGVSLYLAISNLALNFISLGYAYSRLGKREIPEWQRVSVAGLFFEIVALGQGWGCAYAAAILWSVPSDDVWHRSSFLSQLGDSVFEMSLVMAGVGWAGRAPTTLAERVVAWCAAIIGGTGVVNVFLISVLLSRRAWYLAPEIPIQSRRGFISIPLQHSRL